jgi:hypothetical protein
LNNDFITIRPVLKDIFAREQALWKRQKNKEKDFCLSPFTQITNSAVSDH